MQLGRRTSEIYLSYATIGPSFSLLPGNCLIWPVEHGGTSWSAPLTLTA